MKAWVRFPLNPVFLLFYYLLFCKDITVITVGDMLTGDLVDWSNLGMILSVITAQFIK